MALSGRIPGDWGRMGRGTSSPGPKSVMDRGQGWTPLGEDWLLVDWARVPWAQGPGPWIPSLCGGTGPVTRCLGPEGTSEHPGNDTEEPGDALGTWPAWSRGMSRGPIRDTIRNTCQTRVRERTPNQSPPLPNRILPERPPLLMNPSGAGSWQTLPAGDPPALSHEWTWTGSVAWSQAARKGPWKPAPCHSSSSLGNTTWPGDNGGDNGRRHR